MGRKQIHSHTELIVYQRSFDLSMRIFQLSKGFPNEERFALTDQIRRSSRAVCANLAEAWQRRRYRRSFISRLNDAEAELAETQTWLQFAAACAYLELELASQLRNDYQGLSIALASMIIHADNWLLPVPE